jgi:prepilin-type N-terminal cleavage/methylation domain-containing protein
MAGMKNSQARRRSPYGFSVVELLVVIGVVAMLISILLPALVRARESAQMTQCMSNLRQWGVAARAYADANGGWLPREGDDGDKWFKPVVQCIAAGAECAGVQRASGGRRCAAGGFVAG